MNTDFVNSLLVVSFAFGGTHALEQVCQFRQPTLPGLGYLGKGWIVCGTNTLRLPYWALLSTLEQAEPIYSASVAVWPTARHWPDHCKGHMYTIITMLKLVAQCDKLIANNNKALQFSLFCMGAKIARQIWNYAHLSLSCLCVMSIFIGTRTVAKFRTPIFNCEKWNNFPKIHNQILTAVISISRA